MGLKITLSGQTIVKPTALGPVANTDTKLLIYGAISKGPSFGTGRDAYISPTVNSGKHPWSRILFPGGAFAPTREAGADRRNWLAETTP